MNAVTFIRQITDSYKEKHDLAEGATGDTAKTAAWLFFTDEVYRLLKFYLQPFDKGMLTNPKLKPLAEGEPTPHTWKKVEDWEKAEARVLFQQTCDCYRWDSFNIKVDKIIQFKKPKTLNDFLYECEKIGAGLLWKAPLHELATGKSPQPEPEKA